MRYITTTVVAMLLASLGLAPGGGTLAQSCSSCAPPIATIYPVGYKKVCFNDSFNPEEEEIIRSGALYWNGMAGNPVTYWFGSYGDLENCNILIELDASMSAPATALVDSNGNGYIIFKTSTLASGTGYLAYASGHEFMHMLGFNDYNDGRTSTCDGLSMMAGVYDGHPGLPSGMLCGDQHSWNQKYVRDEDQDGYTSDSDCAYDPTFDQVGYHWINPGIFIDCGVQQSGNDRDCDGQLDYLQCGQNTPIVIDIAGDGIRLTSAGGGVFFDMFPDGKAELLAWTESNNDDSFLVLDRNDNGVIDSGIELFGNFTPQPYAPNQNGFLALAVFDALDTGGNRDGWIDANDSIFTSLRLWRDANHDGVSQPSELSGLAPSGLRRLSLDFKESKKTDRHGNQFKYRSRVVASKRSDVGKFAWDVVLTVAPSQSFPASTIPR